MCGEDLYHGHRAAEGEDEFVLDTPTVRRFVEGVRATIEETRGPEEATEAVRPAFARLLSDRTWLPPEYRAPAPESGMGGGIGQWPLSRVGPLATKAS